MKAKCHALSMAFLFRTYLAGSSHQGKRVVVRRPSIELQLVVRHVNHLNHRHHLHLGGGPGYSERIK